MVRTQIQLPDEVHMRAKRICEAREISFAELARRGIEYILGVYAEDAGHLDDWQPPTPLRLGWKGLSDEQIKAQAQATTTEVELSSGTRKEVSMLSIDTNILLHACNEDSPSHRVAYTWIASIQRVGDVAISEFILAELYGLLRNPAVLEHPLAAAEAVAVIQTYRRHPRWRLIGFPSESRLLHDTMWSKASASDFAFRRLYDIRSALTLTAQGVTEFATVNVKDFKDSGFRRVWNPLVD